jgi:uncharacterized protein YbjT (DUF2867 family)
VCALDVLFNLIRGFNFKLPLSEMKKALVIGATGLVGKQLVRLLLEDPGFSEVCCLVRRHSGLSHPKLTEHVVDFKSPEAWSHLLKGDVLFSCMRHYL